MKFLKNWAALFVLSGTLMFLGSLNVHAATKTRKAPNPTPVRVLQNDAQLANMEKQMAQMVNAARKNASLSPLIFDENLAQVARAHSTEMRDKSYFAHQSPTANLREPLDRYIAAFGQTPAVIAENIYRAWSSEPQTITLRTIQTGHNALMNSPGHRANILYPSVQRIGIGIITNKNGDLWITQMFSRPSW